MNTKSKTKLAERLGEKIPCTVETLTPLHIGSGAVLTNEFDFVKNGFSVSIVRQSDLLKYLEENEEEFENFQNNNFKLSALKSLPQEKRKYYFNVIGNEIREFERDGFGVPYIPGSSIKGALRSVLLNHFIDSLDREKLNELLLLGRKREFAAKFLLQKIFGKNPNSDFMRTIEVFDAHFDEYDIDLYNAYVLSLNGSNDFGWKNLRKRFNAKNIKNATPIVAEYINPRTKTNFSLKFDKFVLSNIEYPNSISSLYELAEITNNYAKKYLEEEREFFVKINSRKKLDSVIKQIEELVSSIPSDNNSMLLKIGWGGGWKAMTGNYIEDEALLNNVRQKFKLGKKGFDIFPKTRRIIFDEDVPKYLSGWVKITFNDKMEIKKKDMRNEENTVRIDESNKTGTVLSEDDIRAKLSNFGRVTTTKNKKK